MKREDLICRGWTVSLRTAVLMIACFLLGGCSPTVNQSAFTSFDTSVATASTTSESVMSSSMADEQNLHIANVAKATGAPNLLLSVDTASGTLTFSGDDPILSHEQAVLDTLTRYNTCVKNYADLLAKLSDPSITGDSTLEANAASLAQNSQKILGTINPKDSSSEAPGILSTAFTAAMEEYLKDKQASTLALALKSNQGAIKTYSEAGKELVQEALENCRRTYQKAYQPQVTTFIQTVQQRTKATDLNYDKAWAQATESERTAFIKSEYALADTAEIKAKTLESLYKIYDGLPAAHRDLAKSITTPGANLDGLTSLYSEASHLVDIYNSTQKTSK